MMVGARASAAKNIANEEVIRLKLVREGFTIVPFNGQLDLTNTPDYVVSMPGLDSPGDLFTYGYSNLASDVRIHDCYHGILANISRKLSKYGDGTFCFADIPNAPINLDVLKCLLKDELKGFSGHRPISCVYVSIMGGRFKMAWRSDNGLHYPDVSKESHWRAVTEFQHADNSAGADLDGGLGLLGL